jgi:pyridoxamine 5'-phosphate oxidase family protein
MTTMFSDAEVAYLRGQRLGRLPTVRRDGTVQNSPVGYGYNEKLGTIDIGGRNMADSRKFRNIAEGSKAAFVVDDVPSLNPWRVRCLEIRGEAEALTEPADSAAQTGGPIIRIHPRRVVRYGIE